MRLTHRALTLLVTTQAIAVVSGTVYLQRRTSFELRDSFAKRAESTAKAVGKVASAAYCSQPASIKNFLKPFVDDGQAKYMILRSGESVIASIGETSSASSETGAIQSRAQLENSQTFTTYASVPSCTAAQSDLELEVGLDFRSLEKPIHSMLASEIISLLFQLLIAATIAWKIGRLITTRVEAIENGCNQIAQGHFSTKLNDTGSDEFSAIARSVNRMSTTLQLTLQDRDLERNRLVNASKLSSLGEMAGGIAHEINNPLTIITGKVHQLKRMLERGDLNQENAIRSFEVINSTAERIAQIIRGLRLFSRNADDDPKQVSSLPAIIKDSLGLCTERFHQAGIEIKVNLELDCEISCRPTQISQIIVNLLNNSFDAISMLPEKWVSLDLRVSDQDMALLLIKDSGPGIPKEIADKLMQPFFTTKPVGKGTGLGLSISRGIIEQHGGKLRLVNDSPNTCFEISIPTVHAKTKNPPQAA